MCLHQTALRLGGWGRGLKNTPAEDERDLPEALQGLADRRCPGHPVSKGSRHVRSATSVPPCPQPTHTDTGGNAVPGCPRPGLSMRLVSYEVGTEARPGLDLGKGELWDSPTGGSSPGTPPWWLRECSFSV